MDFKIRSDLPFDSLRITKAIVETKLNVEELWNHYTGVYPDTSKRITSPLRVDKKPTCSFYWKGSNLYMKDWNGHFHGDIYNAICYQNHLPYGDLKGALFKIQEDFPNILTNQDREDIVKHTPADTDRQTVIQIKKQLWTNADVDFWTKRHISSVCLAKFDVSSVAMLWINGRLVYNYRADDPCYAYYFGEGRYKLYFPLRRINRFIGNSIAVQGFRQLPETGDLLIVTKSLKDVMVLWMLGYSAIALQSESSEFYQEIYDELRPRFKKIVVLYDNDEAGRKGAEKICNQYKDLTYIEIPEGWYSEEKERDCKDIDEIALEYDLEGAQEVMDELLYYI